MLNFYSSILSQILLKLILSLISVSNYGYCRKADTCTILKVKKKCSGTEIINDYIIVVFIYSGKEKTRELLLV